MVNLDLIAFYVFILIVIILLKFTPIEHINAIGDFFKKLLPGLPIEDIIKWFKGK